MKQLLLLLVFIGLLHTTKAQYFQTGQDPASLKWRQINTENFQIIYPDYYENKAQRLAAIMEKVYLKGGASLHYKPKKISIILHTQTVKSNGLVAWAPKRAEFYTIPYQGIYAQDWIEQLAVHEFRHVVQIDKINSELPEIIKILLGEQGTALVFGAYLPWWFIEGDAVVSETAFSNSGRGRFPSFLMEHKALAVEKGNYKYDKAYNSSYKDFVPDHYKLGYYLVGSARAKYGSELWNSVLNRVGKKPFSLNPFNKVLKEKTGLTKVQLYNSVFDSLQKVWIAEDVKYKQPNFEIISLKSKTYTNYQYNHWLNDTTIISYKTALNEIPSFVRINSNGFEKKIHWPGIIFDESVNYSGELIVWSEQIPDVRWQHSGESFIRVLNLNTLQKRTLKTEYTAFAPSISPDKKQIVVVESDFSDNYYLSVYQIENGKLLSRFQSENNNYFFSPDWLNDKEIVVVMLFETGKKLAKLNLETARFEIISEENLGEIKNLTAVNNNLYFVSSYSGKNDLYKLNLTNNLIERICESRFGIESPSISANEEKIVLSDYTSDGFRLIEISRNNFENKPLNEVQGGNYRLANQMQKQESGVFDFTNIDTIIYKSEKYNKTAHLLNFHSWAPVAVNTSTYEFSPGASLMSQNKLGTAELNVGYKWKIDEKAGNFFGKYSFKGWYPVFDFELNSGKSGSKYTIIEQTKTANGEVIKQDTILKRFTWNETNLAVDMRLPLVLSRGKFNRFLQPEIKYDYSIYKHDETTPEQFFDGNFQSLSYRIYFQQLLKQSFQDVYPNFGFITDLTYKHSPIGDTDLGSLFLSQSYIYLPGLLANHGIRLYGGIQDKNTSSSYSFAESIKYPRGWGKINTTRTYSFAGDYKFPLFYPEWNVGNLVYLQRVNASVFADFAILNGNLFENGEISGTFNSDISSFGVELTGNMNFLRFYAPVEMGVRASYLPDLKNVYFDFLFSIDFNSL